MTYYGPNPYSDEASYARVVACRGELEPAWRDMLARQSASWSDVADPAEALLLLARSG